MKNELATIEQTLESVSSYLNTRTQNTIFIAIAYRENAVFAPCPF
jgi:hypothetical protein